MPIHQKSKKKSPPFTISCQYDDSGVFIGLITVPSKTTTKQFVENELENGYFKQRSDYLKSDPTMPDDYYRVKSYNLFGDFDLCLVTLTDDLEFANRAFQLNHKKASHFDFPDNYNYQVITGISPKYLYEDFKESFRETFFPVHGEKQFPFIAISKFKINDGLLIGNGLNLLTIVNCYIKEKILEKNKIKFILVETFCNNEICVLLLSNSFKRLTETILSIRESSLKDIDRVTSIVNNSLFFAISPLEKIQKRKNLLNSHLFTNSHTIFGYDLEYNSETVASFIEPEPEQDTVKMYNQWDIKPGHLKQFLNLIKDREELKSEPAHIPIGRGGLTTKYYHSNERLPNFSDYIGESDSENLNKVPGKNLENHYNRFRTYINSLITYDKIPGRLLDDDHIHLSKLLTRLVFNREELIILEKQLEEYRISYVLKNRILRIFHNYNDAIQDPLLFATFIELRGLLVELKRSLEIFGGNIKRGEKSSSEFHEVLKKFVDTFDKVYHNRYHQSYRMLNSTDFNIEYNGGIQQLISSYDTAYKAVLSGLGEKEMTSVVEVSDIESVISERFSLKINYLHVFSPELFATLIVKEASNYYHTRRSKEKGRDQFYSVFRIENDGYTERQKIRNSIRFENSIIKDEALFDELVSFLDYHQFRYFFADRLYLYLGFNGNKQMFFHWFFFMYIQNTKQYQSKMEFSRENLIKQLIRLNVLFFGDQEQLLYMQLNPPSKIFLGYWNECFLLSREIVRLLFNNSEFEYWYLNMDDKTHQSIFNIIKKEFKGSDYQEILDLKSEKIEDMEEALKEIKTEMNEYNATPKRSHEAVSIKVDESARKFSDDFKSLEKENAKVNLKIFNLRKIKLEPIHKEFKSKIMMGNVVEFNDKINETSYILSLSYSFISIFYDFLSGAEPFRDFYEPGKKKSKQQSKIFADPLGGVTIPEHKIRKDAFKYRVAFLKSLWNFNYIFKKKIITGIHY